MSELIHGYKPQTIERGEALYVLGKNLINIPDGYFD